MKKQSAGRRVRREKIRRKKMQVREKVGKSRNTVFFRGFVAPEGWKVGSLKRRVRRHLGRWEMKSCTPLWREAHLEVKCVKNWGVRTTFGSWDVEKVHAVVARSTFGSWDVEKVHAIVARSTFPSQNVQSTPFSDHFWKLRCRKSARRCWAKHRATFGSWDLEKVHAVVARSTFRSQNVQSTRGSDHFWRFRCRFASLRVITLHYTLHYTTLHYTLHTLQYITLHYTPQHYNYVQLQNYTTTLHYTPLHTATLNHTTLHYTTLERSIDR